MIDSNKFQQDIEETLKVLFNMLDILAEIEFVKVDDPNSNRLRVNISTDDSNLLIGYHGETLNSLQQYLNVLTFKKHGTGFNLLLDVAGYREERGRNLVDLANNAADKARFIDKKVALYPMNSYERRIIHEQVSTLDGVTSFSEGEGSDRRVIIAPDSVTTEETGQ